MDRAGPAYRSDYLDDGYGYSDYYDLTHGSTPEAEHDRDDIKAASNDRTGARDVRTSSLDTGNSPGTLGASRHPNTDLDKQQQQDLKPTSKPAVESLLRPVADHHHSHHQRDERLSQQQRPDAEFSPAATVNGDGSNATPFIGEENNNTAVVRPLFVGEEQLVDDGSSPDGNDGDSAGDSASFGEQLQGRLQQFLSPIAAVGIAGGAKEGLFGRRLIGGSFLFRGGGGSHGGPVAATLRVISDPDVASATRRITNVSAQHAVRSAQLLSDAAALRVEAFLRVSLEETSRCSYSRRIRCHQTF